MTFRKTVLITGCSDGGLGAALALAFHLRGLRVFATARNPTKMATLREAGMETIVLDVLSDSSIKSAVEDVERKTGGSLDILLNNAGGGYNMPISDLNIDEAKKLFDLNVWSYLAITQAFLPLLLKSKGMIVNNTSCAGNLALPGGGTYNASKAAASMFNDCLRLELKPFDLKVVDLKTAAVLTKFFDNQAGGATVPAGSIYEPARKEVDYMLSGEELKKGAMDADVWAKQVVGDLLKSCPSIKIWRGTGALLIWIATSLLPTTILDGILTKEAKFDVVGQKIKQQT